MFGKLYLCMHELGLADGTHEYTDYGMKWKDFRISRQETLDNKSLFAVSRSVSDVSFETLVWGAPEMARLLCRLVSECKEEDPDQVDFGEVGISRICRIYERVGKVLSERDATRLWLKGADVNQDGTLSWSAFGERLALWHEPKVGWRFEYAYDEAGIFNFSATAKKFEGIWQLALRVPRTRAWKTEEQHNCIEYKA